MAVRSGFFDSIDSDRMYSADDLSNFFYSIFTNGVCYVPENCLKVIAFSGMSVKVCPGYALINGKYLINDASLSLTIPDADDLYSRIDRIVIRFDMAARSITIKVRQGTPAQSPEPPVLSRSGGVYELSVAQILVEAGTHEITTITDEREDESVCGFITFRGRGGTPDSFLYYGAVTDMITGVFGFSGSLITE